MELIHLTIRELADKLARNDVSSEEATQACLARVSEIDKKIQAFLKVDEAGALAAARASDARRAAGKSRGPLEGVPLAVKDNILTEGVVTTCASKMLENYLPPYDATVVRLLKEAGAVLLGKVNLDEFAMGSSTESSAFFSTKNPWDLQRTPGGSSGGSSAAVAAREAFGALGTDTGGSIRQPASFTHTVGLKPTWGRVSRFGVVAYASSLDQVGMISRTCGDAAEMLKVLAAPDENDSTCVTREKEDYLQTLADGVKGLKLGLPREYFVEGLDSEVAAEVHKAAKTLEKLGAELVEVSLPHTSYALACYYVLATAEASSNLARFDGIRFGHRAREVKNLRALYADSRAEGFGAEVKRRILLGTYALSAGYYDAYYVKAQKVRALIRQDFENVFQQVDALVCPASPVPPFKLGEKVADPLSMYLMDVLTLPCNLAGLPGLSVPCGFTSSKLPIGLQVLGRPFDEARLLRIGHALERELQLTKHVPPCQ